MGGTDQGTGVMAGPNTNPSGITSAGDTDPGIGQMETLSMAGPGDGDPGFGPGEMPGGVMAGPGDGDVGIGGTEQGNGIVRPGDGDPGFGGTNQGEGITVGTGNPGDGSF